MPEDDNKEEQQTGANLSVADNNFNPLNDDNVDDDGDGDGYYVYPWLGRRR